MAKRSKRIEDDPSVVDARLALAIAKLDEFTQSMNESIRRWTASQERLSVRIGRLEHRMNRLEIGRLRKSP